MKVIVKSITPPRKTGVLGHAAVEIELEDQQINVSDLRILRNRNGQLWLAMPSVAVQDAGKSYHYESVLEFSLELRRAIEDAVLTAFAEQGSSLAVRP